MRAVKSEIKRVPIKIGQEWVVKSEHFMAFPNLNKRRAELIESGVKFKIIHPEEWHFLTDYGKVFFAKPHEILEHCKCLEDSKIDIKKNLENPKKVIEVKCSYMRKPKIKQNENI